MNRVIKYLDDFEANIICLQETHWLESEEKILFRIWTDDCFLSGLKTGQTRLFHCI